MVSGIIKNCAVQHWEVGLEFTHFLSAETRCPRMDKG